MKILYMFYRNSGFATEDFKKMREVFLQIFGYCPDCYMKILYMFYRNSGFATKDFKKIREVFLQIFVPFKTYIVFSHSSLTSNSRILSSNKTYSIPHGSLSSNIYFKLKLAFSTA